MSLFDSWRTSKGQRKEAPPQQRPDEQSGYPPSSQDTLAAIDELSQLVKNNPDLVEIYLALGNLYRAQGEIERAVLIRTSLIVRPGLDPRFKARALYELGRDYKRGGFLDRALSSFEEAISLAGEDEKILRELARLAAMSDDYEKAARYYARLRNFVAQAHFMVHQAKKHFDMGEDASGKKWLNKALKAYPGSVEAWLATIMQAAVCGNIKKTTAHLREAFAMVPQEMRFVLLEGVLQHVMALPAIKREPDATRQLQDHPVCSVVLPMMENDTGDVLLLYYGAMMILTCGDRELAKAWFEKSVLLRDDFWPARLELMALDMAKHDFMPIFQNQLEFFISQVRCIKRFVCRACGLKRDQTFFICPRCKSWHSIGFRFSLHE